MTIVRTILIGFILVASPAIIFGQWIRQNVDTSASFRGLSAVSEKVVWASGTGGTVVRTIDGGKNWSVIAVPGAEKLDFRDIEAFNSDTAYALSIGDGDASRIYKTIDGGKTWKLQFTNTNPKAFFDALACWDAKNCIAMSDPVEGHYLLITTTDGETWKPIISNQMPAAKDGEAAFAASGTCLYINPANGEVFLVSGGTDARVFRSTDKGRSWISAPTPMVKGTSGSGIFSIAFRNALDGTIVGGNYEKPNESTNSVASTRDGGKSWYAGEGLSGYRSAVAYIDDRTTIAVGINGTDISYDRGDTWKKIGTEDLNAVAARGKDSVWAVGPKGMVVRLATLGNNGRANVGTHPLNVTQINLSHTEIRPDCEVGRANCSSDRLIAVAATSVQFSESEGEFSYVVSGGKVLGRGANVKWDLSGVLLGTYTITAGIEMPTWGINGMTRTAQVVIK